MTDTHDPNSNGSAAPASMAGVGTHEVVLELIKQMLPQPSLVADLAAGEGAFSVQLRELGHDVRPFDLSSDHWKVPDMRVETANLDAEFGDAVSEKFDAVVAIEIIEHLENPFRFVRECSKMLKPGGLLFLTTPNVEAVSSRLMFLYTGRLKSFGAYETVRPAHITPIFKWKLDMILDEAGFETIHESFNRIVFETGTNFKAKIAGVVARVLDLVVKGEKGGEGRIVVARRKA